VSILFDWKGLLMLIFVLAAVVAAGMKSCSSQPCLNGAVCVQHPANGSDYICMCLQGFEGKNCEAASAKALAVGNFILMFSVSMVV
jgi:EGF-like domain